MFLSLVFIHSLYGVNFHVHKNQPIVNRFTWSRRMS